MKPAADAYIGDALGNRLATLNPKGDPVLMLAGGGVAWASSGGASEPTGAAQAWVDSPMDGERLEPGTVRVRAHAHVH